MNINLYIERLVLDGLSIESHQLAELKASTEAELGRLLTVDGIVHSVRSVDLSDAVRGSTISVDANRKPLALGKKIANAVYGGIQR